MMGSKKIIGVFAFLLALSLAVSTTAQPAKHLQLYTIHVKSGAEGAFTAYMKKIVEAANETGAPQGWGTGQGVLGTAGTNFYVFVGFDKWGERDAWNQVPEMLTKAFGQDEAQKIGKMGGDAMWGFETRVFDLDADRSWNIDSPGVGRAPFLQMLIGKVKPDMVMEYQSVVSELKEAQIKAGATRPAIRRTSRFGPSFEFYYATPFQTWGDWDDSTSNFWANVAKAKGENEAVHLRSRLLSCYEEREIFVIQILPELNRTAPESTSNE